MLSALLLSVHICDDFVLKDFDVLKADIFAKLDENKGPWIVSGGYGEAQCRAANRDKEATRRETRLILTMGEMIAVATLGILICWPASPV